LRIEIIDSIISMVLRHAPHFTVQFCVMLQYLARLNFNPQLPRAILSKTI
jgi:hypothetical protein